MGGAGYDFDPHGNSHSGDADSGESHSKDPHSREPLADNGHKLERVDSAKAVEPNASSRSTANLKIERRRKRPPGLFRMIWRQSGMERVQRILGLILGLIIIILGVLIAPLPGPFGLPIAVFGLVIALRSSYWARRVFIRFRRKYPRLGGYLRAMLRKRARFGVILWSMMLRTEHLVRRPFSGGRPVFLPFLRHKWFRARRQAKWLPISRLAARDPIAVVHLAVTAVPLQVLAVDPPGLSVETLSATHFPLPIPVPDPAKINQIPLADAELSAEPDAACSEDLRRSEVQS